MRFLKKIFDDENTLNEKAVIGFAAFLCLVLVLLTDVITSVLGMNFTFHEFIFNGFLIIVLGSFGIASVDKYINKRSRNRTNRDQL